jgi:hypothetical protein
MKDIGVIGKEMVRGSEETQTGRWIDDEDVIVQDMHAPSNRIPNANGRCVFGR